MEIQDTLDSILVALKEKRTTLGQRQEITNADLPLAGISNPIELRDYVILMVSSPYNYLDWLSPKNQIFPFTVRINSTGMTRLRGIERERSSDVKHAANVESIFVDQPAAMDEGGFEVEDNSSDAIIKEPFDPTLIRIETKPSTINLLIARIRNEEINLSTGFQRKAGIWNDAAQSRLIESLLIRIPIPAFYVDATDDDRWLIVDGLQRLTTIKRFVVDNELALKGLEFLKNLEGKHFLDLPRNFQRRIEETEITVFAIEKRTPPEVKFNIFKRINTGGLPLSSQEIRHALNQGPVTKMLESLAESPEFKTATSNGVSDERMGARECVLRFLAFSLTEFSAYKSQDFDGFLNEAMQTLNRLSVDERNNLENKFYRSMKNATELFGDYAFRKQYHWTSRRSPINKALFEAWSINLSRLTDQEIRCLIDKREELSESFKELMGERVFEEAISQGTGDTKKIIRRFASIRRLIEENLT